MKKYTIEVRKVETDEFEVEAEDYESARQKALNKAYENDWLAYCKTFYMTPDEEGNWEED